MKKVKNKIIRKTLFSFNAVFFSLVFAGCSNFFSDSSNNVNNDVNMSSLESRDDKGNANNDELFFVTEYYIDENSNKPSEKTTIVKYGEKTKLYTTQELGFSKKGLKFKGWMIYRDSDNKWYVKNKKNGKTKWVEKVDDRLPKDYEYDLRNDGGSLYIASKKGIVKLFGVWEPE